MSTLVSLTWASSNELKFDGLQIVQIGEPLWLLEEPGTKNQLLASRCPQRRGSWKPSFLGSQYFSTPTPVGSFVDSSTSRLPHPYPPHSAASRSPHRLSGWKGELVGARAQPQG